MGDLETERLPDEEQPPPPDTQIVDSALPLKKKRKRSKCSHDGCTNKVQSGGLCFQHGAPKKYCTREGCSNWEVGNGFCVRHGAFLGQECRRDGCTNRIATGGTICDEHRGRRCSHEGCNKRPVSGGVCVEHGATVEKQKKVKCSRKWCSNLALRWGVCVTHGSMVGKECSRKGCTNRIATGGSLCDEHRDRGYRGIRCSRRGCTERPVRWGVCIRHGAFLGEECRREGCTNRIATSGTLCDEHCGRRCSHEGCTKRPVRGGVCAEHGAKCKCSYNGCSYQAKRGGVCHLHAETDPAVKCLHRRCATVALKEGFCSPHYLMKLQGKLDDKCIAVRKKKKRKKGNLGNGSRNGKEKGDEPAKHKKKGVNKARGSKKGIEPSGISKPLSGVLPKKNGANESSAIRDGLEASGKSKPPIDDLPKQTSELADVDEGDKHEHNEQNGATEAMDSNYGTEPSGKSKLPSVYLQMDASEPGPSIIHHPLKKPWYIDPSSLKRGTADSASLKHVMDKHSHLIDVQLRRPKGPRTRDRGDPENPSFDEGEAAPGSVQAAKRPGDNHDLPSATATICPEGETIGYAPLKNAIDTQRKTINVQQETIAFRDGQILQLNHLHQQMMAKKASMDRMLVEKDRQIMHMNERIVRLTAAVKESQEKESEEAGGVEV